MDIIPPNASDADKAEDSKLDLLKENSLKGAGYSYLAGDAALFASGIMSGRYKEASSGLLWGLGGLACAKYGNPDAEIQLKLLSQKLGRYLRKQGVEIPQTPDTESLAKQGGVIDRIEAFIHTNPSQVLNTIYAIGGIQLGLSGLQHKKGWDTTAGTLVTAGALAGLLITEKKPDPDHPAEGFLDKAKEWIQEKPLRIPAALYIVQDVAMIMSAIKEKQANPAQKSYLFKFLAASTYIFGNVMLSISSKGHGGNEKHKDVAMEKLADASAQIIAAQAQPLQEALVQQIAAFLSSQPEVKLKSEEISALLHKKLASTVKGAPDNTSWAKRIEPGNSNQITPSL